MLNGNGAVKIDTGPLEALPPKADPPPSAADKPQASPAPR
jgi:hypothetical protein